jgi:FMN reductase
MTDGMEPAMNLVAILGSVTPPGRLSNALQAMLAEARETTGLAGATLINLADVRIAWADGRPPEQYADDTAAVVAQVREADAVVLASPVYRGSYTGALKNLLDQLPIDALAGKPVGIVAMGATPHHYLGVDWHLRDVLAWFGALLVPSSVYLASSDFTAGAVSEAARQQLASLIAGLVKLRQIAPARGEYLGPRPLAAGRD